MTETEPVRKKPLTGRGPRAPKNARLKRAFAFLRGLRANNIRSLFWIFTRRLWVRLTLAFSLVVLIGITTTMLASAALTSREASNDLRRQLEEEPERLREYFTQPNGVMDSLQLHYRRRGGWEDVNLVLQGIQAMNPVTDQISITYSLVDVNGGAVYNTHPEDFSAWSRIAYNEILPVENNGEAVGYFHAIIADQVDLNITEQFSVSDLFVETFNRLWWIMLLCGVTAGVLFGTVMGRALAAPLTRLSDAAQAIGARDLSRRVQAGGSTEAAQLARAFNQMAADLQQAEKLRQNMVADVAHELRTPLTVLQGNLRAILDDVYNLDKMEVASLYDQTRVLSRLVNDLHDLSQAEARQLPLRRQVFPINQIITQIGGTFAPVAEMEGVTLTMNLPDLPLHVDGDLMRLSQVLNNLLNNALTHTPHGGRIIISLWESGANLRLSVRDTGRGINTDHLPHIFDRFYRADRARSRNTGGAGLGLAIAKAIIEAHDGTIQAESAGIPGMGTTFTVELPLVAPHPVDDPVLVLE